MKVVFNIEQACRCACRVPGPQTQEPKPHELEAKGDFEPNRRMESPLPPVELQDEISGFAGRPMTKLETECGSQHDKGSHVDHKGLAMIKLPQLKGT